MTRRIPKLAVLSALLIGLSTGLTSATSAQITVTEDRNSRVYNLTSTEGRTLANFSFVDYIAANGFNQLVRSADITFEADGTLIFEILGSDAENTRFQQFIEIEGASSAPIIGDSNFINGSNGQNTGFTLAVSAGESNPFIQFVRQRVDRNNRWRRQIDTAPFGIIIPDITTASGLETVIFAFENRKGTLDYDDLLVRATFVPNTVPEPSTWLMLLIGILAAGLIGRNKG